MNKYQNEIDALQPYSLDALSVAPICQRNCSQYWINDTIFLLPIFLNIGCVPGDIVETVELEFLELLQSGLTAVLLDDEDHVRRVRYNSDWELEIDGFVYSRDEEISQMGTRRLVRWE